MFGIPSVLKTDNSPPFNSSMFSQFTEYLGFHHSHTLATSERHSWVFHAHLRESHLNCTHARHSTTVECLASWVQIHTSQHHRDFTCCFSKEGAYKDSPCYSKHHWGWCCHPQKRQKGQKENLVRHPKTCHTLYHQTWWHIVLATRAEQANNTIQWKATHSHQC